MILGRASAAYIGLGDIASYDVYGGLRAYTAAIAVAATQALIRVRRVSDDTEQDILVATSGGLDTASALSFAGVDTSGNATSLGTSVALTGLGSAAHVGSTITGTGFSGTYCVSVGALVAGAQTVTTNTSQTIGVAVSVTLNWGLRVKTRYDQTGNSRSPTQTTFASQPYLLFNVFGARPSIYYAGAQALNFTSASVSVSQPFTSVFAAMRSGAFTSYGTFVRTTAGNTWVTFNNAANAVAMWAGTVTPDPNSVADGTLHAILATFNGASSELYVDGTGSGALSPGAGNFTSNFYEGNNIGSEFLTGHLPEWGASSGAMSGGNKASTSSNVLAWWQ